MPMPNIEDTAQLLLDCDQVRFGGGSVARLLTHWRLHELDVAIREAWEAGVAFSGDPRGV